LLFKKIKRGTQWQQNNKNCDNKEYQPSRCNWQKYAQYHEAATDDPYFSCETVCQIPNFFTCQRPACFDSYKVIMFELRHYITQVDNQKTCSYSDNNRNINRIAKNNC